MDKIISLCGDADVGKTTTLHMLAFMLDAKAQSRTIVEPPKKPHWKVLKHDIMVLFDFGVCRIFLSTKGDSSGDVDKAYNYATNSNADWFITASRNIGDKWKSYEEVLKKAYIERLSITHTCNLPMAKTLVVFEKINTIMLPANSFSADNASTGPLVLEDRDGYRIPIDSGDDEKKSDYNIARLLYKEILMCYGIKEEK